MRLGVSIWLTVPAIAIAVPASAQPSAAVRNAKAAFVYSAQATQNAALKAMDEDLLAQRRRVDALGSQLMAARAQLKSATAGTGALRTRIATLEDEASAAQERFASDLARRDADYARELAALRGAADTILSTPEGLRALELSNAGDWEGAKQVETALRAARQKARDIAAAADARAFALLALDNMDKGRETSAAVAQRYEEIVALDPSQYGDWFELHRLRLDLGDQAGAEDAARNALKHAADERERSVALIAIGDVVRANGRLDEALDHYRRALALRRALAAAQPDAETAQRDLALALDRVGDALAAHRDYAEAEKALLESYAIRRPLAARMAAPLFDMDLAISLERMADLRAAREDWQGSAAALGEALALWRKVRAALPASEQVGHGMTIVLNKLTDLALGDRDLAAAARYNDESLAIRRAAVVADPGSYSARRDLSVALNKQGDLLVETDAAKALAVYQESLALARALFKETPDSIEAKRDVNVGLGKIASTYLVLDDGESGRPYQRESYRLRQEAFDANPDGPDTRRDLMDALYGMALYEEPGFGWQRVVAFMEDMKARGLLDTHDQAFLDRARERARATP